MILGSFHNVTQLANASVLLLWQQPTCACPWKCSPFLHKAWCSHFIQLSNPYNARSATDFSNTTYRVKHHSAKIKSIESKSWFAICASKLDSSGFFHSQVVQSDILDCPTNAPKQSPVFSCSPLIKIKIMVTLCIWKTHWSQEWNKLCMFFL